MWGRVGLRMLEGYLVARLISSPLFNRIVHRLHGRIARYRSGEPTPGSVGGSNPPTASDQRGLKKFMEIYKEEFQNSEVGQKFYKK